MAFETLLVERERDGMLVVVTFNRPKQLNAINAIVVRELDELCDALETDAAARVILFTGAGDRAFVAGADIRDFVGLTPVEALTFGQRIQRLFSRIEALPQVTIAAVNGFALGGGCELTQCCDLVVAAEAARFGQPEVNLGVIPGAGGTQRLARIVGMHRAKELNLLGEMIDAQEAHRIGVANRVVPGDRLMSEARALADKLIAKAPITLRMIKEAMNEGYDLDLSKGLAIEAKAWSVVYSTEDKTEGVAAFLEKRKPGFKGRQRQAERRGKCNADQGRRRPDAARGAAGAARTHRTRAGRRHRRPSGGAALPPSGREELGAQGGRVPPP
jgi:enoyl-CoA hydratase